VFTFDSESTNECIFLPIVDSISGDSGVDADDDAALTTTFVASLLKAFLSNALRRFDSNSKFGLMSATSISSNSLMTD
jgi:hypothetical protein